MKNSIRKGLDTKFNQQTYDNQPFLLNLVQTLQKITCVNFTNNTL